MKNQEPVQLLAKPGATSDELRDAAASLRGEPLAVLAACEAREEDVDIVVSIAGKVPVRISAGTTTIVVRLPRVDRAVYARVEGVFLLDAIRDAIVRGLGIAADAPIVEIAVAGGAS